MKTSPVLPYISEGPGAHQMSCLRYLFPSICTIRSRHRQWVSDICYWLRRCSSLGSSKNGMAQHSNPHCNMWALISRAPTADVLIFYPRYILRSGILCISNQCFGKVEESSRSNYYCKSKEFFLSPESEHYQLSFIQLGGGISIGIYQQQKKFYSLTTTPDMQVRRNISIGVRTITLQNYFQLFTNYNHPADMEFWECPLWCHYCGFHDLPCELPTHYLSRSDFISYSWWQLSRHDITIKRTKAILKKIIRLTIETGSLTGRWKLYSLLANLCGRLNKLSIPALIAILCFVLAATLPRNNYHRVSSGIIGKVYANSMLVLINSRMTLGFEETPSTYTSLVIFAMEPTNGKDIAIEAHNGDLAVKTPILGSHNDIPTAVKLHL